MLCIFHQLDDLSTKITKIVVNVQTLKAEVQGSFLKQMHENLIKLDRYHIFFVALNNADSRDNIVICYYPIME